MNFDVEKITDEVVAWIRQFFNENGNGCNAIIGISGGKDSSVAAALCVKALGKERVIGLVMPNRKQSDLSDACDLANHLGIQYHIVDIGEAVEGILKELATQTGVELSEQTITNIPPRIRMSTLYAFSQSMNGRVVNTCNLSEDWVGYEVAISTYPDGSSTQSELRMIASALNISLNALKVSVKAPWHDEIAKEKQRMKWW